MENSTNLRWCSSSEPRWRPENTLESHKRNRIFLSKAFDSSHDFSSQKIKVNWSSLNILRLLIFIFVDSKRFLRYSRESWWRWNFQLFYLLSLFLPFISLALKVQEKITNCTNNNWSTYTNSSSSKVHRNLLRIEQARKSRMSFVLSLSIFNFPKSYVMGGKISQFNAWTLWLSPSLPGSQRE